LVPSVVILIARFVRGGGAARSRAASDDLLRQHIERSFWKNQAVEFAQKNRPLGTAPRQWPDRPTRCKATAIERGELMWHTRSTVPMSMPSSSEAVATSTFTWPSFSLRSASRRSLRDKLP